MPRVGEQTEEEEDDPAYYSQPERNISLSESLKLNDDSDNVRRCEVTRLPTMPHLTPPPPERCWSSPRRTVSGRLSAPVLKASAVNGQQQQQQQHQQQQEEEQEEQNHQSHQNDTEVEACASASSSTTAPPGAAPTVAEVLHMDLSEWLRMEVSGRPELAQLDRVPKSHLLEVALIPWRVEKVLGLGNFQCLDIVLHELSFTPLQALSALFGLLRAQKLSVTGQCALVRLSLLVLNVALVSTWFDVSAVYHYIRGESFLKLYVIFNMLEMFERWCRSVGVDLFDLLMASVKDPWRSFLPKYIATLLYCFVHSMMHFLRILLLNVAINTSQSAVFLIICTNNFGEIKSTVFKKYQAESLFPIVASDIVERFYLFLDIVFVLLRLCTSSHRPDSAANIAFWLILLVAIELLTDWIKMCLIAKFSELPASTIEGYREVLIADILLCRSSLATWKAPVVLAAGKKNAGANPGGKPTVPFRGIHSFSHVPSRRLGFSGVPISTLVVIHSIMLLRSPCTVGMQYKALASTLVVAVAFLVGVLAKLLLSILLLGFAAKRRKLWIPKGLELFPKIKAL